MGWKNWKSFYWLLHEFIDKNTDIGKNTVGKRIVQYLVVFNVSLQSTTSIIIIIDSAYLFYQA